MLIEFVFAMIIFPGFHLRFCFRSPAHAEISAEPEFKKLYVYSLPRIEKTSSCTLEYRFRNPKKLT